MPIELLDKKDAHEGFVHYAILNEGTEVGDIWVEYMDGSKEDLLEKQAFVDLGTCYSLLQRMCNIKEEYIKGKIAFIPYFEIKEPFQRKGFGKEALQMVLNDLKEKVEFVILDTPEDGSLIPFYESFGFTRLPRAFEEDIPADTPDPENFMWLHVREEVKAT